MLHGLTDHLQVASPDATHSTSALLYVTLGVTRAQEERVASCEYLEEIKST